MPTFKISDMMGFGPREEKDETSGAALSLMASLFNMFAEGFL
jgi:hypothetical protein